MFGIQNFYYSENEQKVPPQDANTKLLLHFDDTNNQRWLKDYSGQGLYYGTSISKTMSSTSAFITTTYSKFGGSCYDGTRTGTQYYSTPNSSDWVFGTNSFTVEGWFMCLSGTSSRQQSVITRAIDDNRRLNFLLYNGSMYIQSYNSVDASVRIDLSIPVSTWVVGTWKHLAWVRNYTTGVIGDWQFYVDGVPRTPSLGAGAAGNPLYNSGTDLRIGTDGRTGYSPGSPGFMMDEIRISSGARYTGTFTPPTAPF